MNENFLHDSKICISDHNNPDNKKVILQKNGFSILQCSACGLRYALPEDYDKHLQAFSDDYFFNGKDGYPNYLEESEILYQAGVRYSKLISRYMESPGKMIDVGAAAGFIQKGFADNGWDTTGIEPNASMAKWGKENLGLRIENSGLETFNTNEIFDLVSLIQVIGSLHDLETSFNKMKQLLRPGGFLLIESWRMESWWARLWGKHWHEYCPPRVINWFSDKSLTGLATKFGFSLVDKGKPVKKISMHHGLTLLEESLPKFPMKKSVIGILDKLLGKKTVRYPAWDLGWYLFKKNES